MFSLTLERLLLFGLLLQGINCRSQQENRVRPMDAFYCERMPAIRTIWNSEFGVDFTFSKGNSIILSRQYWQFMEDQLYYEDTFIDTIQSGVYLSDLNLKLLIGVSRAQIDGYFKNRLESFDLGYSINLPQVELYYLTEFVYHYVNRCIIEACLRYNGTFFRASKLAFCRDTYGGFFFPLREPCYTFKGKTEQLEMFEYDKEAKEMLPIWKNDSCLEVMNIYEIKPDFCGQENETSPVLNTLFPFSFSRASRGGLFRALVSHNSSLYWLENTPTFSYRYLEGPLKGDGNYSASWKVASLQKASLAEKYYFTGAFVYPRYGNHLDQVYFLLLPKNFNSSTVAVFRRAVRMNPLEFEHQDYSLDEIFQQKCSNLMTQYEVEETSEPQAIAATLLVFLVLFLLLVSLLTKRLRGKSGATSSGVAPDTEQAQNETLKQIQNKRKQAS